jgi:hypothetical protein
MSELASESMSTFVTSPRSGETFIGATYVATSEGSADTSGALR